MEKGVFDTSLTNPSVLTTVTIANGVQDTLKVEPWRWDKESSFMIGLHEGLEVRARFFATYNLMFYPNAETIALGAQRAREKLGGAKLGDCFEERIAAALKEYRGGKTPVGLNLSLIEESAEQVSEFLAPFALPE